MKKRGRKDANRIEMKVLGQGFRDIVIKSKVINIIDVVFVSRKEIRIK